MKKIILAGVLLVLAGISMISCKSHERCPAYTELAVSTSADKA